MALEISHEFVRQLLDATPMRGLYNTVYKLNEGQDFFLYDYNGKLNRNGEQITFAAVRAGFENTVAKKNGTRLKVLRHPQGENVAIVCNESMLQQAA